MIGPRGRVVDYPRLFWLGLGVALLLVANGRWIFPLASWCFAVGWLVYLDRSPRFSGLATALVAQVLIYFVIWQGIIPAPGALYYLIAATYAAVYFLPFLAHGLLASRVGDFRGTLVFPVAWVTVDFLFSRWVTPYGSWASLAYTQSENLPLLQLASVTGTAGIVFLMTWFGSVVAWMLRRDLDAVRRFRAGVAFAVVFLAVLMFGQFRLSDVGTGHTVRTAALVPSSATLDELERLLQPLRLGNAVSAEAMRALEASAARLNDDLFQRTRREARAGARVIAWSETAGRVLDSGEQEFMERARRLAAEEEVVLLLALGVLYPEGSPPFENKVVAVDATGSVAWEYHKAHPIIGAESPFMAAGAGSVKGLDEAFGRVGAVICHDLDFPSLLRQAAAGDIGLIVAPSADWTTIAVLHARMAVFRAVENGFSLLRPTSGGRSIAVDTRGRVVARLDFPEDAMVAHVSASRSPTVYGVVGDLFSWLCLLGLVLLVLMRRRKSGGRAPRAHGGANDGEIA